MLTLLPNVTPNSPAESTVSECAFTAKDGTNSAAFTLGTNGLALTFRDVNADSSCPSIVASTSSSCSQESGAVSLGSIVGLFWIFTTVRALSYALLGPRKCPPRTRCYGHPLELVTASQLEVWCLVSVQVKSSRRFVSVSRRRGYSTQHSQRRSAWANASPSSRRATSRWPLGYEVLFKGGKRLPWKTH